MLGQRRAVWCRWLVAVLVLASFSMGCERKPEDLEKWRNAEGGMEKMIGWAKSSKEPMPVRVRAVQILIEQDKSGDLQQLFDKMKDEGVRTQLVDGAVPTIEAMWKKNDYPKMDKETQEKGGQIKVGESESVKAKDAAYYLQPYAKGESKAKLEAILGEWLTASHETEFQLRDQLGRTTLGQILPRAGDKGFAGMMSWFREAKKPGNIARKIREHADDETKEKFAKVVAERAEKDHPELSDEMRVVVLETESDVILPYLEKAIKDPNSPPALADDAMDAYVRIQGPKATGFLSKLVTEDKGLMRSVAFTRLIELRGTAGVLQAINAMPLEVEGYATEGKYTLDAETKYYCNIIKTELAKKDVKDPKPTIERMIGFNRWPAQLVAARCIEFNKWSDLKPKVEALAESEQVVPGWGEEETTLGDIAEEIAGKL